VQAIQADRVQFVDGEDETYDTIIAATGYNVTFPFLDDDLVRVVDNRVPLYRHVVHPGVERLYFVGLIQPLGAVAPLVEAQAAWIADLMVGRARLPEPDSMWEAIEAEERRISKQFIQSRRHTLEIDFFDYLRQLRKARSAG
jgi:hypothetical protein